MGASHLRRAAGLLLGCILIGFHAPPARGAQNDDSQAVFLVARSEIHDPFFGQSVVLMLPTTKSPLIVGLIVNKPTRMTLGKLFPESPALQDRTEPAYFGGPVDIGVPSVVFHSPTAPQQALRVYGNVYLTFDSDLIAKVFQRSQPASIPHLFLGRAQWAPAQLENEVQRGSWYRVRADGNLIFSTNLQGLWRRLHDQAAPSKYIQYRLPAGPPPSAREVSCSYQIKSSHARASEWSHHRTGSSCGRIDDRL
ncbi:MAG TPA: YqgE/AlgH family protein [Terriglobia bacterium]|nr:YqgE/AlgH family protein [Terriglobia bacterium]